ncbi:uncharacterized protein [Phaseolus vulgaris]|uniref:uncharacterized protein n=1 Tax=Phaseolus vulgaris TaxID=3885 RepID=UPI0035CC9E65
MGRVAEEKKLIDSLKVGKDKVKVNMLQYADDTMFFCEANSKSGFNIKAILHCFELAFGLRVNFLKSRLGGTGMDHVSLQRFAAILNCDTMVSPFVYLGLPVGWNHKHSAFWNGVIEKVQVRLSRWKGKWIWRLGADKGGLWKEVVFSKYSEWRSLGEGGRSHRSSLWWKDLKEVWVSEGWGRSFKDDFKWKVGDGKDISFWDDRWLSSDALKRVFPRLFSICSAKDAKVAELGFWANGVWIWQLAWRRSFFYWEQPLVDQLS